jgi:hypothetical protein
MFLNRKRNKVSHVHRIIPIQSSTQTRMDLRNSAMGDSLEFQHRNPPAISIQDSPIHSERTWYINNHRIHEDLQMNAVISGIKK